MTKFRRFSTIAVILAMPSSAVGGEVLNRVTSTKQLTVAVLSASPPLSQMDDSGHLAGFDIDVANEIGKRLGATVKFINPDFDLMTGGHYANRWDISVASMTPTTKRSQVLDFVNYYYETSVAAVNKANMSINSVKDLDGKKIGIQGGTIYDDYLRGTMQPVGPSAPPIVFKVKTFDIVTYPELSGAFDDLKLGDGTRLDATIAAQVAIEDGIKHGYPFRIIDDPLLQVPQAMAIDKGDPEFTAKVQSIIDQMRTEGFLSSTSTKWFGRDWTKVAK